MPASAATRRCGACQTVSSAARPAARRSCPSHKGDHEMVKDNNKAFWCGWRDGRYGERCCFTENRGLTELWGAAERLDYYGATARAMKLVSIAANFSEPSKAPPTATGSQSASVITSRA